MKTESFTLRRQSATSWVDEGERERGRGGRGGRERETSSQALSIISPASLAAQPLLLNEVRCSSAQPLAPCVRLSVLQHLLSEISLSSSRMMLRAALPPSSLSIVPMGTGQRSYSPGRGCFWFQKNNMARGGKAKLFNLHVFGLRQEGDIRCRLGKKMLPPHREVLAELTEPPLRSSSLPPSSSCQSEGRSSPDLSTLAPPISSIR
ncbi:unnamed protein product [Pleuronectes platessa]|uniref:Uncharacterized protein n=1 Tax=Pleuronectes platessa TaxID=8262 RepID=A0A9N7VI97_PLEPL|nr:unnamed protein product [Pleuronectes platessa]